ncbi:MAG: Bifunctional protein HldE [Verrucomicrobiae bacterium]|nr:Bifunctional protein HldE [Verrucomicrobiae bacterium]
MRYQSKIKPRDELKRIVEEAQANSKVVVQCHGCFDILHPGHLRHLTWAREQGDILVVSTSADSVVNKGFTRPYIPQQLRAENLAALEVVDYVTIDDGEWAGPILELLKPDIYIKGKEFQDIYDGRFGRERQVVEGYGGKVRFSSGDVIYSSSKIIEEHRDKLEPVDEQVQSFCKRHLITEARVLEILDHVRSKRILVVGDTIVDKYIHCDRLGMSADAPVLVVRPRESQTFLGGAGIVSQHAKSFGADAQFVTVVGEDADATYVRTELKDRRVTATVVVDPTRPTTVKTRYLSDGKKLLNVNVFRDHNLDAAMVKQVTEQLDHLVQAVDAIMICDFSYGVITQPILELLANAGQQRGIPVLGDVQASSQMGNCARLKNITVATPSEREARLALCDRESGIADLGAMLLGQMNNRSLIITMAERGMMIFDTRGKPWGEIAVSPHLHEIKKRLTIEYLPSFATWVADPMGAGDALGAGMAVCLAAGATLMEAAFIANCAAAAETRKMGNVPVSRDELLELVRTKFR